MITAAFSVSCSASSRSLTSKRLDLRLAEQSTRSTQDSLAATGTSDTSNLLDLSLRVSGYKDPSDFARAKEKLEQLIEPILQRVMAHQDEAQQASALLQELHAKSGLLKKYNARATTLREILADGEFNCLSASVLFALIANRVGLTVRGELLPSHARIVLTA